jgi:hypothetical protein
MSEAAVDLRPNTAPVPVSYEVYREVMDRRDGIMRLGITDSTTYEQLINEPSIRYGELGGNLIPMTAPSSSFDPYGVSETVDRLALIPVVDLPFREEGGVAGMEQFLLAPEQVTGIISPQDKRMRPGQVLALLDGHTQGELVGNGEPQFMVLSKYDVQACGDLRDVAPQDITTKDGHTITTNRDRIKDDLDALAELHESVFRRQAVQIGYYDGLTRDMIAELLDSDHFVGAAAYDKDTGKPFMFALFATDLDAANSIPWINKSRVENLLEDDGMRPGSTVAMPLVITAKFNGLSVFAETVSLSMHEILYRTKAYSDMYALYSSNIQSILYTPRIINASAVENGATLQDSIIEVNVVTKV